MKNVKYRFNLAGSLDDFFLEHLKIAKLFYEGF